MNDPAPSSALKRLRSPGLGWAEYDADLVDNFRETKRFAGASLAGDLAAAAAIAPPPPPPDGDMMMISSAECSPAITPMVRCADATLPQTTGGAGAPCVTPQRPRRAPPSGTATATPSSSAIRHYHNSSGVGISSPMKLLERLPTSPSDPQMAHDLRKQTLRKVLARRGGSSGGGAAEDTMSAALGGINSNSVGIGVTPIHLRRSQLADAVGAQHAEHNQQHHQQEQQPLSSSSLQSLPQQGEPVAMEASPLPPPSFNEFAAK